MPGFLATVASKLDPVGIRGKNAPAPPGFVILGAATVRAQGLPVATFGSKVMFHGNPTNPKAPGFNPMCAKTIIVAKVAVTVMVEGKPAAIAGPKGIVCGCGHFLLVSPCVTVMVGGI